MPPDDSRAVFGKNTHPHGIRHGQICSYMGAIPVLLPDLPRETLRSMMKNLDGLVLQGGTDISPEAYKESGIENNRRCG